MNPMSLLALNLRTATMMSEAGTVMQHRILAMSGAIPARKGENQRMVEEKTTAMAKSFAAYSSAVQSGKSPVEVMEAALKPVSTKVRANHKRLTKR